MTATRTSILDRKQTLQKIKRIAYEIYENNFQEEEVVLAGIYDKGYLLAQILQRELMAIAPLRTRLVKISLEKFTPVQGGVALDCPTEALRHRSIVVVDDVLNTGRTLMHSLKPLLEIEVKKIQIAVMVDRSHRTFPVAAGYVGYSLSTTIQEHIEVVLEEGERFGVYLS
ncbi:MAG: phosphoribosyltransferase [Cytophagales bacterium]|nr:phosphoribosyltransferase [Cytophagales bacterium]